MPNFELEAERRERKSEVASLQREIDRLRWQVESDKSAAIFYRWMTALLTGFGFLYIVIYLADQSA